MTERFPDAVRWPIDNQEMRVRIGDRLAARLPAIQRRVARRMIAEPAGSRLRRWLLTRSLVVGWAATTQREWELLARFFDRDVEIFGADALFFDLPEHLVGWSAVQEMIESWFALIGDVDWQAVEAIDFGGPHFGSRVKLIGAGLSSGIPVADEAMSLYEVGTDGQCVRQWYTRDLADLETCLAERRAQFSTQPNG